MADAGRSPGRVGADHRGRRGEPDVPYEERREEDRAAIERWARAEGVDLEGEAERAREKLRSVNRARSQATERRASGDDGGWAGAVYPVS